MKKTFFLIFILLLLVSSVFSCTVSEESDDGEEISGNTVTLNVYNWGEYISDGFDGSMDTNAAFEEYFNENLAKKYGFYVKVNYTTYATNEEMYQKIKSGAGSYDIVVPSDYMIQQMIQNDLLLPFDATTLSNFSNVNEKFKDSPYYDPDNMYSVPYTYGMMGVIYNSALVDEEDASEKSWGLLWNEKYSKKILQFNNLRDAFGSAMYYLGLDINSTDLSVWHTALDKLSEQKELVQGYVNDEIFNKMTTASAAVAPYFAGDFLTMAYQNEDLSFYYPKEGTNYFVDAMCIPRSSRNPEVAKEYINFMLSEEPAVANALYVGYASPNDLVVQNEDYIAGISELHEDAMDILYGQTPDEVNASYPYNPCYQSLDTLSMNDSVNTLWESLKTENSTELWVHVSCGVIVVGVLSLAIYNTAIRKWRSKDYRRRDREIAKAKKAK
ncbi:MAG: spermidine/putrescine ABC transporter substrate-binding protein [Clostridia bacterium]|nr:spermidine/putrescine ABC transporter substrate-binding protein [Clostridia bacterium]